MNKQQSNILQHYRRYCQRTVLLNKEELLNVSHMEAFREIRSSIDALHDAPLAKSIVRCLWQEYPLQPKSFCMVHRCRTTTFNKDNITRGSFGLLMQAILNVRWRTFSELHLEVVWLLTNIVVEAEGWTAAFEQYDYLQIVIELLEFLVSAKRQAMWCGVIEKGLLLLGNLAGHSELWRCRVIEQAAVLIRECFLLQTPQFNANLVFLISNLVPFIPSLNLSGNFALYTITAHSLVELYESIPMCELTLGASTIPGDVAAYFRKLCALVQHKDILFSLRLCFIQEAILNSGLLSLAMEELLEHDQASIVYGLFDLMYVFSYKQAPLLYDLFFQFSTQFFTSISTLFTPDNNSMEPYHTAVILIANLFADNLKMSLLTMQQAPLVLPLVLKSARSPIQWPVRVEAWLAIRHLTEYRSASLSRHLLEQRSFCAIWVQTIQLITYEQLLVEMKCPERALYEVVRSLVLVMLDLFHTTTISERMPLLLCPLISSDQWQKITDKFNSLTFQIIINSPADVEYHLGKSTQLTVAAWNELTQMIYPDLPLCTIHSIPPPTPISKVAAVSPKIIKDIPTIVNVLPESSVQETIVSNTKENTAITEVVEESKCCSILPSSVVIQKPSISNNASKVVCPFLTIECRACTHKQPKNINKRWMMMKCAKQCAVVYHYPSCWKRVVNREWSSAQERNERHYLTCRTPGCRAQILELSLMQPDSVNRVTRFHPRAPPSEKRGVLQQCATTDVNNTIEQPHDETLESIFRSASPHSPLFNIYNDAPLCLSPSRVFLNYPMFQISSN